MERWKINLYTLWTTQIFSLMGFGFCVPFIPFYLQEMGVSDPSLLNFYVGLSFTLPAATMAVAAPIWGVIADRYGRKMMIIRAMFCAAILLCLMGFSQAVWQFMALRFLQGIFTGTVTASMGFVSVNTPVRRRAYALGLMTSSNFLGFSIGPFLGGILAEVVGYRPCFYLGAGLMAVGCVLASILVKEDKDTYGHPVKAEGEKGLKKYHLFTPLILSIFFFIFFQRTARNVFSPYIALFVQESLGTVTGAATYTGLINGAIGLATAAAAVTLPRLGDKYNKVRLSLLLTLLSVAVTALLPFSTSLIMFLIVFTVFYFLAGATEPILTSLAAESTSPSVGGALFGVLGTVNSLGTMIAPMIGAGISVRYGLRAILITIPLFTMAQLVCLYFPARKSADGKGWKKQYGWEHQMEKAEPEHKMEVSGKADSQGEDTAIEGSDEPGEVTKKEI